MFGIKTGLFLHTRQDNLADTNNLGVRSLKDQNQRMSGDIHVDLDIEFKK